MKKRYTSDEKYKNPFFRSLPGAYKLLWDYLYHDCGNDGIWIVDFQIAQIYLGADMVVDSDKALEYFNSDKVRVIPFSDGKKWFLPGFISFQYPELKETNPAHRKVVEKLLELDFVEESEKEDVFKIKDPLETLQRTLKEPLRDPLNGSKREREGIGKEVGKEVGKAKSPQRPSKKFNPVDRIPKEWDKEEFLELWNAFVDMRKKKKAPVNEIGAKSILTKLVKFAETDWGEAKTRMEESISKSWKDFIYPDMKKPVSAEPEFDEL